MGLLDDMLGSGVPQGNATKPLIIALGALLGYKALHGGGLGDLFGGGNQPQQQPQSQPQVTNQAGADPEDGGLLGGLGGLLQKLQQNGLGHVADSWVGNGQNQQVSPDQLHQSLGQSTINDLAQRAGVSPQELLQQLSAVLPGLVDKMTPQGSVPNSGFQPNPNSSRW